MVHTAHSGGTLYGYVPTGWIAALFIGLFGASTVTHLAQSIYFRMWWLIPTAVIAGLGETIGWAGRYWSSKNPSDLNAYLMQITTTIIAPTFLIAANFIILGRLIRNIGTQYSRLKPNMYAIVFCLADLVALVIQAVGGAKASLAVENGNDPEAGGHIMLAGIVFQMASIVVYTGLAIELLTRVLTNRPVLVSDSTTLVDEKELETEEKGQQSYQGGILTRKTKVVIAQLAISTLFIFIRSVYRTIELTNGWTGKIIHTQVLFNVLDGTMILIAMIDLNILHPGFFLETPNSIQTS